MSSSRAFTAAISVALVAMATARMAYVLSDGAEVLIPNYQQTFSCEGRSYGYYADVPNECKIFHICLPIVNENGDVLRTEQFSFICPNTTIFDQGTLTCNFPQDSVACEDAADNYPLRNDEFFKKLDGTDA